MAAGAGGLGDSTVRILGTVTQFGMVSQTLKVKAVVPNAVGVPVIAPVALLRVRPEGKEPTDTLQV